MNGSSIIALTLAAASLSCTFDAIAEDIQGVWERPKGGVQDEDRTVRRHRVLKLIWLKTPTKDVKNPDPSKRDRSLVGVTMLDDLKPSGTPGEWDAHLYDAQNGKTYKGSVNTA